MPISAEIDVVGWDDTNVPDSQESPTSSPATAQIVENDVGYQ